MSYNLPILPKQEGVEMEDLSPPDHVAPPNHGRVLRQSR
ncbi:MAG: hypothetical protein OJF51_000298 [Nitrospira sp.]|nr:MAG: hypothetical protein OJF51_000298 [Nitrospira sp.]